MDGLIRDRTPAGRVASKKRGVRFGRAAKVSPDQKQAAVQLPRKGKSPEQASSELFSMSIQRLFYRLKESSLNLLMLSKTMRRAS
jgi:DNA invertase Pin-like site-specific DNA recombinase